MVISSVLLALIAAQPAPFEPQLRNRLAMTPLLNGTLEEEEWDFLTDAGGVRLYQQWEPGLLYFAGSTMESGPIRISIDANGDGWLRGRDNYEVTLQTDGTTSMVGMRRLDASGPNPAWEEIIGAQHLLQLRTNNEGGNLVFELAVNLNPLERIVAGKIVGLAFERPAELNQGITVRPMSTVHLAMDRSIGLPSESEWSVEKSPRSVAIGESLGVKFILKNGGTWIPERVQTRVLGQFGPFTALHSYPFKGWDRRKSASLDYALNPLVGARPGYGVLQARILDASEQAVVLQTSVLMSNPVTFSYKTTKLLVNQDGSATLSGQLEILGHSRHSVRGTVHFQSPDGWQIVNESKKFLIFHDRTVQRVPFIFTVAAGSEGFVPVKVTAKLGEIDYGTTMFLRVNP